jgi:pimeloyl-ACP methyl ester carboxylesterase
MSYQNTPDKMTKKYNKLSRAAYYTKRYARSMPAYENDKTEPDWCRLKKIKVPMLALFGKNDWNVRPDNAIKLTRNLENMRLMIIPGAKHDLFSDKPQKFAAIIKRFLAE